MIFYVIFKRRIIELNFKSSRLCNRGSKVIF